MKQLLMVGTLAAAVMAVTVYGQSPAGQAPKAQKPKAEAPKTPAPKAEAPKTSAPKGQAQEGHTAPLPQPTTEAPPAAPSGEVVLGTVTLKQRVKANGETLPPGTYQVQLTPDIAKPDAKGQTPQLERWVEFRQGKQVKAKEVVSIVPSSDISKVQKDPPPKAGSYKVEMLKGNEYVRVWINRGGTHYLIYMPPA